VRNRHLITFLDRFNQLIGHAVAWFTLAMVLVTVAVVLVRYYLRGGNLILLQESVIYLHAATFMLGAAWALGRNAHVRVDVFYRRWSETRQAWINAIGTLVFLFPMAGFILLSSLGFVGQSWDIGETSPQPGGLPFLYLLKTLIPAMALTLLLQGIVELARNAAILMSAGEHDD